MRCAISTMRPFIAEPAKGRVMSRTTKIATIFGTKTSVISWICVSACSRPMPRPTTSAVIIAGAMTSSSTRMEERAKSMESDAVMVPSDRHVHDGLVGGDDLVAHRHDGIERDFGLVHCVDDVDDVGLAGDLARRHGLALLHRADAVLECALEQVREVARPGADRARCRGGATDIGDRAVRGGGGCWKYGHRSVPHFFRRSTVRDSIAFDASITVRSAS